MPINTDLNVSPYFDDFDIEKQFYRVLFKPGYSVQARELTQLQTSLQNQVEQFGDNIFKEGSIIKGCVFTNLDDLKFVKVENREASETLNQTYFNPESYVSKRTTSTDTAGGVETDIDIVYVLYGQTSLVSAQVIAASAGFTTRPPNLNTFFIRYLNSEGTAKEFTAGETIRIDKYTYKAGTLDPLTPVETGVDSINVARASYTPTGSSFGIQSSPGILFQKGHFLYTDEQILVVEKYSNEPADASVGFKINESLISYLQDDSLYDNANGSTNENAPGADRLKLVPVLTKLTAAEAEADSTFFSLIRYQNGNAVRIRDISQYNVLGDVTARRTYEESGNYVVRDFPVTVERNPDPANTALEVLVDPGAAYVKGFRVETVGTQQFEVESPSNTEIQTSQPISFDYGNYVDVTGFTGHINIDLSTTQDLLDGTNTKIGECFVSNLTEDRAYLFGISMNAGKGFVDVAKIDGATTGEISVNSTLKGTDKRSYIFDTGMDYLYDVYEDDLIVPIRGQSTHTVTSNEFTITTTQTGVGTDFNITQNNLLVITSTGTKVTPTGSSTALGGSNMTVTLPNGVVSDGVSVICYYDYRAIDARVFTKSARDTWLRLDHVTTRKKFSLGFPDVYEIVSIKNAAGDDFTKSFRLNPNQKDAYYDLSFIEYIQGRPRPGNEQLQINLKVFETIKPVGAESFYHVASYTGVDENEIPVYVSESGYKYNLRDCLDFRPQVDKESTMSYTETSGASAPIMTVAIQNTIDAAAPSFTGTYTLPATNQYASADIEYYLPRYDVIAVDSYGQFNYIKGEEEINPRPPLLGEEQLVISEIFVPGAPILSPKEASQQGKREYAVRAKPRGIKRYTMKDIQGIEDKIDRLVYYTSLNQLEQETNNFTVLDENGLTRFKNGFIVDPFNDMSLANTRDANFNAAVHFSKRVMTPAVQTFPLDLKYKTSSGATAFPAPSATEEPKVATLSRNAHVSIINQPYATGYRNCVTNFYNFKGRAFISPEYDATYDTTTNPVEIDFTKPFVDFADALQRFIPLTDAQISTNQFSAEIQAQLRRARANGGTVTFTDTLGTLDFVQGSETQSVGDFVTNFQFQPYMSARDVKLYITGLRPSTRHYFFFDRVDVTQHVCAGTDVTSADRVQRQGAFGGGVVSNENGVITAVFKLPAETFFVGERFMEVLDVADYDLDASAGTSRAKVPYRAYNFSVDKASLSTRMPAVDFRTTTSTRSVTFRPPPPPRDDNRGDPLAQTFFVKKGMGRGSNTVMVSKVDVFFKRKATSTLAGGGGVNGVSLMIREVINGYPAAPVIPFSVKHLEASEVNVSDDASAVTTFEFDAPIALETEKEYAIVIEPDANDPGYLVFTSKVGNNDLTPGATQGKPVVADWGDGVLFTSTNNSAWKSYQDEDLKFKLYRHDFNESVGSVTMTNRDHEFLSLTDLAGAFKNDELVYQSAGVAQTVGMQNGNNVITRVGGSAFDTIYAVGDFIKVNLTSDPEVLDTFEVVAVTPDTITTNKNASQTWTGSEGIPIVTGRVCHYDLTDPNTLYLENSTARSGYVFSNGSTITGADSGSTADIVSIDNINLSYVQPFISRVNDSVCKTTLAGEFIPPANVGTTYNLPMKFNDNNSFSREGVVLYSKSNNVNGSLKFDVTVNMSNGGNTTSSPFVDVEISKLLAYKYDITNVSGETANFISKTVELAQDFDAEDFQLILSAHRPVGTTIKTYIRAQNTFDSQDFADVDWVELELFEGIETYSTSGNLDDYREYKYRIADANKDGLGVYTYVSSAGTFKTYRKFAVRIELLSPNVYSSPIVKDYRGIALT